MSNSYLLKIKQKQCIKGRTWWHSSLAATSPSGRKEDSSQGPSTGPPKAAASSPSAHTAFEHTYRGNTAEELRREPT